MPNSNSLRVAAEEYRTQAHRDRDPVEMQRALTVWAILECVHRAVETADDEQLARLLTALTAD